LTLIKKFKRLEPSVDNNKKSKLGSIMAKVWINSLIYTWLELTVAQDAGVGQKAFTTQ
jgi:hypothetical protein